MRNTAVTIIITTLLAGLAPATALALGDAPQISVRMYDAFGMPSAQRREAESTARAILAQAAIAVIWFDCVALARVEPASGVCAQPLGPLDLVVRLVAARSEPGPAVLGTALISPQQNLSCFATVFADSVVATTRRARTQFGRLLGRVIAHEIGHLLLGSSSHSQHGLMRAAWRDYEIQRNVITDWTISIAEAELIHLALVDRSERVRAVSLAIGTTQ